VTTTFERLVAELARYAEGVHELAAPAQNTELDGLPSGELRDFYASFDGATLFVGALEIYPASAVTREADRLIVGATSEGDRIAVDRRGRVLKIEEGSGEATVEGSSYARWLEAYVVGESVVYDREGEFRDEIFADDGEGLTAEAELKRARRILKVDPGAPGPRSRLARALEREGDVDGARSQLGKLVAECPEFAWAWFDLGRLARDAAELHEAEQAFARAAECAAAEGAEHAGFFAAQAARAALERGDEAGRKQHAARALALDEDIVRGQLRAALARADEGAHDEARELAELARAVAPRDLQVLELLRRLK
jgi:tetratricopeptide (TPR) repeat protein